MWKCIAVILCFNITYTQCAKFGDDNSYTCHCKDDVQCDKVTGVCGGGCARGWYGASCQKQNVALDKTTSQVDTNGILTSDLAVDGDNTTNIPDKCSDTSNDGTRRWWRVDLEEEYPIKYITIYYRNEPLWTLASLNGFSLHVNKENQEPQLCYQDKPNTNQSPPPVNNIECSQTVTGRYVNISNFHTSKDARYLVLCEVEIYVCSIGTFGPDCTDFCHCLNNERCSETGQCPSGCADGWTGTTCSQSSNVCSVGTFGSGCTGVCHCLNNERCSDTGQCPGGCADGWAGPTCGQECNSGRYGEGCNTQCSMNCKGSTGCNHINGKCNDGCTPGYNDVKCIQECTSGRYGEGCNNQCSMNCKGSTGCNHISGKCNEGCTPGYIDDKCIQKCTSGYYGEGCSNQCSKNCKGSTGCNHISGICNEGCTPGYNDDKCSQTCDNGTYGAECSKTCSDRNCLVETSSCNHINGGCQGDCKEGFSGIDCVKCEGGVYGAGCSKNCSDRKCKDSNLQCDSKTGECLDGCLPGYQSIDCTEECDNGTYGQDCQFKCSTRFCQLQDKDTCSNIDGACDCLDGYEGTACTVKKSGVCSAGGNTGSTDQSSTIIGTILGLTFGLVAGALGVLFIMKRRLRSKADKSQTVTSNQSGNNATQHETTIDQPVTQPSSNNQDNPYAQLDTIYQNENAYERLEKV